MRSLLHQTLDKFHYLMVDWACTYKASPSLFSISVSMSSVQIVTLLSLFLTELSSTLNVQGVKQGDSCFCDVNLTAWQFPVRQYEDVANLVDSCEELQGMLQTRVQLLEKKIPQIERTVGNMTDRLRAFQYLKSRSLYYDLQLHQMDKELERLEVDVSTAHQTAQGTLSQELSSVREMMKNAKDHNKFNLETVRDNLRVLKNRLETCRTIDAKFTSNCSQRLLSNISEPVVTKLSPYGKSYPSGSWGREAKSSAMERYWIQPLVSGNRHGNVLRFYPTHEDFMSSRGEQDIAVAPSYSHTNAIQGPGTLLYDEAVFYQCYNTGELCRYDLSTKATIRKSLPDAGFNNRFPYCYYTCHDWTDIDFSADETGLWVIYATEASHGNIVLSRLDSDNLNITHTWTTRLFKKSVTNAFVVCGVLYATRYLSAYEEEVFYAFDTNTGKENNMLAVKMEKVAPGMASLHYSPVDKQLYMYNDSYLLAFKLFF
ncbi:olfactomedin-like [Scleropages formosus]|nr:olfactomedin-like [Scleropages formosus]